MAISIEKHLLSQLKFGSGGIWFSQLFINVWCYVFMENFQKNVPMNSYHYELCKGNRCDLGWQYRDHKSKIILLPTARKFDICPSGCDDNTVKPNNTLFYSYALYFWYSPCVRRHERYGCFYTAIICWKTQGTMAQCSHLLILGKRYFLPFEEHVLAAINNRKLFVSVLRTHNPHALVQWCFA